MRHTLLFRMPLVVSTLLASPALGGGASARVKLGADILLSERLDLLRGRRVGVVTNQSGRLSTGEFLVDAMVTHHVNVVRLFGPEHGFRGSSGAGEKITDTVDATTGIQIVSLYGTRTKPTPEMLHDVDVLVYDVQDVGARFYTYISTMILVMEAAAENGIPIIVCDRPNPIGMMPVDGPVRDDSLKSFVGMLPIPVVYGLTCGELAQMANGEGWLTRGVHAKLTVVPLQGWRRDMTWEETGLPWIPPSPNIPTPDVAYTYPATCFIEATNVSEGRGTPRPFETIGAPFIEASALCKSLEDLNIAGWEIAPATFTPSSSKHAGEECHGVSILVTAPGTILAASTGLAILRVLQIDNPVEFKVNQARLRRLLGTSAGGKEGIGIESIRATEDRWKPALDAYKQASAKYKLY